jgi:hypothetical protein
MKWLVKTMRINNYNGSFKLVSYNGWGGTITALTIVNNNSLSNVLKTSLKEIMGVDTY